MYHEAIEKVSKQVLIRDRYDNFIGGKWVAPSEGRYFDNPSPVTGKKLCAVPRSTAADIEQLRHQGAWVLLNQAEATTTVIASEAKQSRATRKNWIASSLRSSQ